MSQKSNSTDKLKSAIGKSDKSNKHITKISAKSADSTPTEQSSEVLSNKTTSKAITKTSANTPAKKPRTKRVKGEKKPLKEVFILARPFVALGRYIRDSWRELRQVRWPNRAATWKMTLAVLVYCAIFMIFILLLDTFFTFLFNLFISK